MVKKFEVVTFGSAVVDTIVKTHVDEKGGNLLIPYGSKMLMEDLNFEIGGGGTNTAVAFARFGLKTGYIGKVGNDSSGEKILNLLKKEKIEFLGSKVKGDTTGFSVVLLSRKFYRSILTYKGINNQIELNDIKKFDTKWLYLSSLLGKSFETQARLVKELKKKGVKIAFNPSEYLIKRKELKNLLKMVDVVIVNKEEANLLYRGKDKLRGINKMGPNIVVITDGSRRIHAFDGIKTHEVHPPKTKVLDKTGAGDAFAAGFVSGLIKEKSFNFCLELGMKEAASVVKNLGAKNKLLKIKLK